ncbi:MAG: GNAT family N-acetyltransferase [ANME-2 cluster archaeon]|jgi:ribosomal-protein-alanine N-acetyltransferase|nr:GNAT family N-acetyltransferase [ANME-2 cluster archaeon]
MGAYIRIDNFDNIHRFRKSLNISSHITPTTEGELRSEESDDDGNPQYISLKIKNGLSEVVIHRVLSDEILDLVQIETQSFTDSDYPIDEKLFRIFNNSQHAALFSALQDGVVVGYVCLIMRKQTSRIYSLTVGEGYRGKGIGTKLLEAAEKHAFRHGTEAVRLEVRCNSDALRLYQKLGYTVVEKKLQYYGDGGDAFSMNKQILQHRIEDVETNNN